ncbi:SLC13 family permease [Halorubrum lipolyticum]|uniref:Citrate/succinate, 2-oxoglutarate/malate transporter n=1 Tax=Halorubrum lipolyticum DSM 21995 TaxID=1227482 RepID=M0NKB1_9EURY|nr:SLC13 family permease [Halorubrum lipolyticum]EMA58412.1 citrate/succinate, 2-oxoglutarate/malate transporter [Halorubrum lipolyticum DSM 21995]
MPIVEVSGVAVVFLLIVAVLVAFVTEVVPNDVTAIGVVAALVVLEPWTGVGAGAAISGFANPATVTIIAMYMLSAGVQRTGVVERLGVYLAEFTAGREFRALVATVCTTGPIAGFVNNTPVVAVFIPMVTGLAENSKLSPSKLLLPLSYAAILGGTLTLIGTSTNILASDFARLLIDGRDGIGMFEFTGLGAVLLAVGSAYLLTVGWRLTPARVPVDSDPVAEFDLDDYLTHLYVRPGSVAVGLSVEEFDDAHPAVRILQVRRDGEAYAGPHSDRVIEAGDGVVVHGPLQAVAQFRREATLGRRARETVTEETFESSATDGMLAKAIVPDRSPFVGETVAETGLHDYHETSVLAVRRGGDLFRTDLADRTLEAGDLLLVRTTPASVRYFTDTGDLVIADERALDRLADADIDEIAPLSPKTPIAVGVLVGVVALAALDVLPIVIAALAGVVVMVVTGCLTTADAYDAVSWNVIFLLAGVIPLGIALESTGGAAVVSEFLVATDEVLPTVGVMFVLYAVAGLLASVITPVATAVLMIPVGVSAAAQLGANEFAFLLAVMFASATSFMTPVGYQTNLMVYGPGGYEFADFLRVGGPLQLLLAVVATAGIAVIWGV